MEDATCLVACCGWLWCWLERVGCWSCWLEVGCWSFQRLDNCIEFFEKWACMTFQVVSGINAICLMRQVVTSAHTWHGTRPTCSLRRGQVCQHLRKPRFEKLIGDVTHGPELSHHLPFQTEKKVIENHFLKRVCLQKCVLQLGSTRMGCQKSFPLPDLIL